MHLKNPFLYLIWGRINLSKSKQTLPVVVTKPERPNAPQVSILSGEEMVIKMKQLIMSAFDDVENTDRNNEEFANLRDEMNGYMASNMREYNEGLLEFLERM